MSYSKRIVMKMNDKKYWEKPEVSKLSVKSLTLSGTSTTYGEGNTNDATKINNPNKPS